MDAGFLVLLCCVCVCVCCCGGESGQMSHQQRRPAATISLIHSQPDVIMQTHLAHSSAHIQQFITVCCLVVVKRSPPEAEGHDQDVCELSLLVTLLTCLVIVALETFSQMIILRDI